MPSRAVHWTWPGLVERCQFGTGYMMSGLLGPVPLFGPLLSAFLHAGPHIAPMHAEIRTFRRQSGIVSTARSPPSSSTMKLLAQQLLLTRTGELGTSLRLSVQV